MVNIEKKISEVLDKGFVPFPNSPDKYWDMNIIHAQGINLLSSMLREVIELIKTKHNLVFDTEEFIKENYEQVT